MTLEGMSMSKKKKKGNRTEEARRGTKADPERIEERRRDEALRKLAQDNLVGKVNDRPSWFVEPLDKENLSKRESITRVMYIVVEVLLFLIIVIDVVAIVLALDEFTVAALRELFVNEPTYMVDLVNGFLQLFAASIIQSCHKHYEVGDIGSVLYNLGFVLCAEVFLQSIVGIVGCALLLWRSWRRCSVGLSDYKIDRNFTGKLADMAYSLILLVGGIVCYYMYSVL